MRVAIVNDMKMAAEALRRVVVSMPGYRVAWIAADGAQAVAKCQIDRPDLVLMDLIMPGMNGVEATRQIVANQGCPILLVTATVQGNMNLVYEAMGHGALDVTSTPVLDGTGSLTGAEALLRKIANVAAIAGPSGQLANWQAARQNHPSPAGRSAPLVAIGASTGGPQAIATILANLPQDFPAAVVLVQHVDQAFAPGMVRWLGERSTMPVVLAQQGDRPEPGCAYLAATNDHLILDADHRFAYVLDPVCCAYRPSVDAFFQSLLTHHCPQGVAVLLTGMGKDGAQGLKQLRAAGWHTIAQDEQTSVLYGMPRAAAALGAAAEILPVEQIAAAMVQRVPCNP